MAQHNPNPADSNHPGDPSRDRLDRLALDRLARCAADDELSAEDANLYESAKARHTGLESFERSERSLRRAVGRCMGDVACPDALRARVLALASQPDPASAPAVHAEAPTHKDAGEDTVPRTYRFPAWQRLSAMAAAIVLLVVGVVYFQGGFGQGVAQANLPTGVQLAGYMSGEHVRCMGAPESLRKFTERDLERVPAAFRDVLGEEVSAERLLLGDATFIAAGKCQVPGKGPSVHMLYEVFDASGQRVEVSLYVQRCEDERFVPGKAYVIGSASTDGGNIIGWRAGEVIYYLVTGAPDLTRDLASRMNAPRLAGAF